MNFVSTHEDTTQLIKVVNKCFPADGVVELEFSSVETAQLPEWEPGAHFDLKLPNSLSRQYSLMRGKLNAKNWRIAVLVEKSGRGGSLFVLNSINVGMELTAVGPRNHFPIYPASKYLFIAGGIGITALIPMIEYAELKGIPWNLEYLGKSLKTMAYAEDLTERYGDKIRLYAKEAGDRFDVENSLSLLDQNVQVYACGPERLNTAIEQSMVNNLENLHVERFHPRELVITDPDEAFTVYCQKSEIELLVPADESILMAADFEGIDVTGDCLEGTCGSCETRVFEGEVDHRDSVLSAKARAEGDTMMICISRAKGKRLVIDL